MAVYNPTTEDLESGLGARPPVLVVREATKGDCKWKLCTLLSLLAICATAGAVFFAWNMQIMKQHNVESQAEKHIVEPQESAHHHMLKDLLERKSKAAIHAEGYWTPKDKSVTWSITVGHAFSQGGLDLIQNQIVIPASGLYFVYSQASFQVKCNPADANEDQLFTHLSHSVHRFSNSYGGEKPLLSTVNTACTGTTPDHDPNDHFFNTIYLGGVFHLKKGDQLRTETERLADLNTDGGKTFFGVFAL